MPRDDEQYIEDDEGNRYTHEQVQAAVKKMTADEAGEGSLGGLAESDSGSMAATEEPNADVDRQVASLQGHGSPSREINPAHIGDFLHDNVFGGFNGKYITGKRPTTLFDFATDALSAYGGEDVGRRNAQIRKSGTERDLADLQGAKFGQDIKSGRARQQKDEAAAQKTGLESHKLATEAVGSIFNDVDSDLWETRMGELEKEHGVVIPKTTKAMMTRWMEKAREAGVTNPQEVLDNPDKYDPALVNRTRHTFALVTKNVQESHKRDLENDQQSSATGIAQAKEGREADVHNTQQLGLEQAIDLLHADASGPDPQKAAQAKAKIAAILEGGTSRQKVLDELAGSRPTEGGRNLAERGYLDRSRETLIAQGKQNPTPGEIAAGVADLKRQDKIKTTQGTKSVGIVTEAKANVARGRSLIQSMRGAVKNYGLADNALAANVTQPVRMFFNNLTKDPKYATLAAFPATMSNIARSLGEKGVLTDEDVNRIKLAINPGARDTSATYNARLDFVEQAMIRGQEEVERALNEGRPPQPVDLTDLTFDGDPTPGTGAGSAPSAPNPSGDKAAMAKAALDKANQIKDPDQRKAFLAQERDRIKEMQ